MKLIITLLLAGLPTYLFCQDTPDLSTKATLFGNIENHDGTVFKTSDVMGKASWEDPIAVNGNKFTTNLALDKPAIKMMVYGNLRKNIFLEPGKSLQISFDAKDVENTFRYGGDLAVENTLLDSVYSKLNDIDYKYIYSQPLEVCTLYLDSIKNHCHNYLNSILNNHKTSDIFKEYATASIDYKVAYLKIYLGEYETKQYVGYYNFLDKLKIEDSNYLDLIEYRMFLYYYIEKETNKRFKNLDSIQQQASDSKFNETLKTIEQLKDASVRAYSLYNTMNMQLKEYGVKGFDRHYEYFNMHNTDADYAKQISLVYDEKKRMAPGQPATDFTLTDANGNQVSLNDFRGKYVYIDFWITTCPRSARELPYFLKLYEDYNSKNIAFVSISPDESRNTWLKYVREKRNVGTSLWSDKFLDSEVFNNYQVNGTPTYVLIDPDGKIIDPVAPKPSSTEIRTILDELLKKK